MKKLLFALILVLPLMAVTKSDVINAFNDAYVFKMLYDYDSHHPIYNYKLHSKYTGGFIALWQDKRDVPMSLLFVSIYSGTDSAILRDIKYINKRLIAEGWTLMFIKGAIVQYYMENDEGFSIVTITVYPDNSYVIAQTVTKK